MNLLQQEIGQIVRKNYKISTLFLAKGIDFCCGGDRTLESAAAEAGVDANELSNELEHLINNEQPEYDFDNMPIDVLIHFILSNHHEFIYNESEATLQLMDKVYRVHGSHHPELATVHKLIHSLVEDMNFHQSKEENILFPYILDMYRVSKEGGELCKSCFGDVRNPISAMEADHESTGAIIMQLAEVTNNFEVPADGCNSYTVLYARLNELYDNILRHVHLENNILHLKAIELQSNL